MPRPGAVARNNMDSKMPNDMPSAFPLAQSALSRRDHDLGHRQLRPSSWFARLSRLIARHRVARRTRAELEALDDRMLRDIGLQACDVPRVVALLHHDAELWAWPGARRAVIRRP